MTRRKKKQRKSIFLLIYYFQGGPLQVKKNAGVEFWAYCRENSLRSFKVNRSNAFQLVVLCIVVPLGVYFGVGKEVEIKERNKRQGRTI